MLIEQPEALKTWLTAVLKPLCDADPAALAKYVLALIKKDKSEEELHKMMVGQLEVFLEGETESFVDLVLRTLETQDYITTPVIPNTNPPNPILVKNASTKDSSTASKPMIVPPNELPNLNEPIVLSNGSEKKPEPPRKPKDTPSTTDRIRSRNRSRSRSWDRSKRSKSRERPRPRAWRNKSPPSSIRRFDRRQRSPSPLASRRSRTPPKHRGNRYRSRSRSPQRNKDFSGITSPRQGTPTQDSNHGDLDLRLNNSTQSIQSVIVPQQGKRRCRDFDEKGYCMRGEMCPYDHGVDPVVLEDSALTSVLTYNPNSGTPTGTTTDNSLLNTSGNNEPHHVMMGQRVVQQQGEYNPQAPQMWNRMGFRGPRPPPMGLQRGPPMLGSNFPMVQQRELIPVPVLDNKPSDQYPLQFRPQQQQQHDHLYNNKKKPFDFNRLGPRSKNPTNCSLELKKIPQGLNTITHLNNHFAKFGKPVNIQVCYDGDPEAAIVTFSSHAEANAAYRSTEAVLNNRFIKVFWHNTTNESKQSMENVPPSVSRSSIKDRLGVAPPNTNKVLNLINNNNMEATEDGAAAAAGGGVGCTTIKDETAQQATAAAIKKNQELLAVKEKLKKNQDEQRKEAYKININLRKRKQELLDKQLSQQKILIEKMEKIPAGPQRDHLLETIKKSQESIENIKKDLQQSVQSVKTIGTPPAAKRAKEDVQREMLDAELDLISKQQEGVDTSEIQKKLLELKAKVAITRVRRVPRRFVSRHLLSKNNLIDGLKGNKVTKSFQKHTVDHRPTRVLISGYETDEQDSVLKHFQSYGEIADYTIDSTLPSIIINYKTRKAAEMALIKGKHFQDRTLSITWSNVTPPARKSLVSESEEDRLIEQVAGDADEELGPEISEETLLQDDEEEDDESEDRSWRR